MATNNEPRSKEEIYLDDSNQGYDSDVMYDDINEEEEQRKNKGLYAWVISAVFHILIIAALTLILISSPKKPEDIIITTTNIIEDEKEEEEEKEIEIVKTIVEVDDPVIVETPIVTEEEVVEEKVETENEMEAESAEGVSEAISDLPLVGSGLMGNIGGGGGGGGSFGQRSGGGKKKAVMANGGSRKTESAVDRALEWLKRHQDADGSWHIDEFEGGGTLWGDRTQVEGVSGLALLAFIGAGHTHTIGKYRKTVKTGVAWILQRQQPNGQILAPNGSQDWNIYDHAINTLMLAELYGMTGDSALKGPSQKAIDYLMSQRAADGSWEHKNLKSTSVLGWCVMAMKSSKLSGLNLPADAFDKTLERLESVTEMEVGGSYYGMVGYTQKGQNVAAKGLTMTCVGMLCYQYLGKKRSDLEHQAKYIIANLPQWVPGIKHNGTPQNFYHWYYGTLAMFQMGGDLWKNWNNSLINTLLPNQRVGGPLDGSVNDVDGSWDPVTTYDDLGGRVYTTAMGALNLEVYYRYKSVFK